MGEALDFGDHLCALNAEYGSEVLVSSETVAASLDGLEVRPMELVSRGNRRNAEVYELLALKHGLTEKEAAAREAFRQGVVHLRKGDPAAARKMFERAAIDGVKDAPLAYFMDKAVQSAPARAEEKDKKGRGRKPGA